VRGGVGKGHGGAKRRTYLEEKQGEARRLSLIIQIETKKSQEGSLPSSKEGIVIQILEGGEGEGGMHYS